MKTYQIKMAVKKVKPLVWRRCLIPSGITFAQLKLWEGRISFAEGMV